MFNYIIKSIFLFQLYSILNLNLIDNVSSTCISINNSETTELLNVSYHEKCYKHAIEQENCCRYFLLNEECKNTYLECVSYEEYVLNNMISQCHSYNTTLNAINYSNKCHQFTLHLEPYCCGNLESEECFDWYTQCINHDKNDTKECNIPTKYRNDFCSDYTKHIDENCCQDFTDICVQIYQWCYNNHPNETSILDLFISPKPGYTIGNNLKIFNNIIDVKDCAQLCIDTRYCRSFDYVINRKDCYISKHVIGDVINSDITVELMTRPDLEVYYYELIFIMPYENTLCNVKNPSWLGDGFCENRGGYNTEQCGWDGGDCCRETCYSILCGIFRFECKDPAVLYPPTNMPTNLPTTSDPTLNPTTHPTNNPTSTPTNFPSYQPTQFPTKSPTYLPSNSPTSSPTITPTNVPTSSPTRTPTNTPSSSPTFSPTTSPTTNTPSISPSPNPTKIPTIKPTIQIIIEKSQSDDSDLKEQITSLIIAISVLSLIIVSLILLFWKCRNNTYNSSYNLEINNDNGQSFSNPLYDSTIKNNKQSSNHNSNSNLNDNPDTISSRTRSKTQRAYQSQSSFGHDENSDDIYDDIVYQEDNDIGYVDEDETEFMSSSKKSDNIEIYEDDTNDTYVETDLIIESIKNQKKSKSNSSLAFSEA